LKHLAGTRPSPAGRSLAVGCVALCAVLAAFAPRAAAKAPPDLADPPDRRGDPRGVHVLDGSYVMNVGELQVNITNHGLIGSQYTQTSTYSEAPSAQWPAGSGVEYLWSAGLWVGGILESQRRVSTGQYEREFRPGPDPEDTIYEARDARLVRPIAQATPQGRRGPSSGRDDDRDGRADEDLPDGHDNDGDGRIDEDWAQVGDQMMVATMYDDTPIAAEIYPDHRPLHLKVVQKCYGWSRDDVDDAIGFDFEITNTGQNDILDTYLGLFVDGDVGPRTFAGGGDDDLHGRHDGIVRTSHGQFVRVTVFWFRDSDFTGAQPGWFGIVFLDHTVDPTAQIAPVRPAVSGFQAFAGTAPFQRGGPPNDDADRYAAMSYPIWDPAATDNRANDWSFLISTGPFPLFKAGATLRLSMAMVVGNGLQGLLENAANLVFAWHGRGYNLDDDPWTGGGGLETKICLEDISTDPRAEEQLLYRVIAMYGDRSCIPDRPILIFPIMESDLFTDEDGKRCAWVAMDNCIECDRLAGEICTKENNLYATYNCGRRTLPNWDVICTGFGGRESQVRWTVGETPPEPPGLRLVPRGNAVELFWDDRSEYDIDPDTGQLDFESYRVWRADDWDRPWGTSVENGPASGLWRLVGEYDLDDTYVRMASDGSGTVADTLALGENTGLDVARYEPICLVDSRFAGLAEAMQVVVDADTLGRWVERPPLRDLLNQVTPGLEPLLPWEAWPAELDTFFMIAARAADPARNVPAKRASRFYAHTDIGVHNGFLYFYSVTATDRALERLGGRWVCTGPGLSGDPVLSFAAIAPGTPARTAEDVAARGLNCFAYPNPATRASLAEFQQMHPNADDPTGVHVNFANLPRARNVIRIFTLDGDLVQEIIHRSEERRVGKECRSRWSPYH